MSIFLSILGVISAVAGVAAIVIGIPVKEFSFGNTLIESGVFGLVGGLIILGLGVAVAQLQRISEMLGARPLARAGRGLEPFEQPTRGGRIPFPPKPKTEAKEPKPEPARAPVAEPVFAPPSAEDKAEMEPEFNLAPALPNPDVPLMAEAETREMPLSPREAAAPGSEMRKFPESTKAPSAPKTTLAEERRPPPRFELPPEQPSPPEPPWRTPRRERPPFETAWPAPPRTPAAALAEPSPPRADSIPRAGATNPPEPRDEPEPEREPGLEGEPENTPVAILKSGVVDGMGYTLYVDGSIEAELPDGTLRFASINELRAHLERTSRE